MGMITTSFIEIHIFIEIKHERNVKHNNEIPLSIYQILKDMK